MNPGQKNLVTSQIGSLNAEVIVLVLIIGSISISAIYIRSKNDGTLGISDLSEEQRDLVEYLNNNESRIPQKSASEQFEWSDARTSRVTSELVELGVVNKEREDRRNYLILNDESLEDD